MKKYLIAGVALVASLSSAAAFAENFNGPHIGLTTGLNAFQSNFSQTGPGTDGSSKANTSANLFNYGLFAGYGHTMGQFYLGGELLLAMQNGQATATIKGGNNVASAFTTIKEGFSVSPALRLGALVAPKTLAFVKIGTVGTQMEATAVPVGANANTTKYKKTLWGYSFGAGLETLVTDKVSIRADYTYNTYPTKSFTITDPTGGGNNQGKISPRDNLFRLGVAYNFSC